MAELAPLHIHNISKTFKQHCVLSEASFIVEEGEIFGLIGLNGVGKTTLIKIILDLLRADSGMVSFFGQDAKKPQSRRHISYLPEKFFPSPLLTGEEFLTLALAYYRKTLAFGVMEEKAGALGLMPGTLKKTVGKYSKGMAQKLGLLSMFLSEAPLLILDEPMSGLDPSARIQLKDELSAYSRAGKTVFFTSHILADIHEICDRIAVLHGGKIGFVGTPHEFVHQYKAENLERAFIQSLEAIHSDIPPRDASSLASP